MSVDPADLIALLHELAPWAAPVGAFIGARKAHSASLAALHRRVARLESMLGVQGDTTPPSTPIVPGPEKEP